MKSKEKSKNGKEFTKDTLRNREKIIIINVVRKTFQILSHTTGQTINRKEYRYELFP